jgi:hypothetical protein
LLSRIVADHQGVKYCLVTAATVAGREPAHYFSRGNRHAYLAATDAEDRLGKRSQEFFADEEKIRAVG